MKLLLGIVMLSFAFSLCGITERFSNKSNSNNSNNSNSSNSNNSNSSNTGDTSGGDAAKPEMTAAQKAAIEGGQQISWAGKGLSWTVPANWKKQTENENSFMWQSPSPFGFLIVNISNMSADFPVEASNKAMYDSNATRKQSGELMSYRWISLDGVKSIEELEPEKSSKSDPRRLLWRGYRKYNGLVQLITIILSSESQNFPKHEDALHAILYSTKIEKE